MNAAHHQPPITTGKERPRLFGPVAKSRARFEVRGEVRFGSDLVAYNSSVDAGTLVGAVRRGAWFWPLPFWFLFVLI